MPAALMGLTMVRPLIQSTESSSKAVLAVAPDSTAGGTVAVEVEHVHRTLGRPSS